MSESCQKLVFTHPIVVLKSGLKNNWMKKLDPVNRPSYIQILKLACPMTMIRRKHLCDCFDDFICKPSITTILRSILNCRHWSCGGSS